MQKKMYIEENKDDGTQKSATTNQQHGPTAIFLGYSSTLNDPGPPPRLQESARLDAGCLFRFFRADIERPTHL